jgi:F0F1-type ATP synthase membrane subunit b/b'
MELTIGEIINILAIVTGAIGSIVTIYTVINKIVTKRINSQMTDTLAPIKEALEEIKRQNMELKQQGEDTKKEIILIMKLNQTMIDEMKTLGHVNGKTSEALEELNDYLLNK